MFGLIVGQGDKLQVYEESGTVTEYVRNQVITVISMENKETFLTVMRISCKSRLK